MTPRDVDTDRAQGAGAGETPTLPPETMGGASLDAGDSMDSWLAAVAAAPPVRLGHRPSVAIEPGTLVDGTYRVLRRLGGGGMGVVYLAEHVELQREVALKLHLGELDDQELLRLRREARVMARLSHPNVLAVHGVGKHDGRMFIAMEYAEGGTLKTWLEAGQHAWRDVVTVLAQAGRGLAAAHRVGVVHRDFKPDNVLIGADGRPRVADFGLARRWDDGLELATDASAGGRPAGLDDVHRFTVTGAVVGTPAYMSPEQFDGIEVGPASDQFSFCVVLYEALLGRRPFSGRTTMELAAAVHMGELRPVPPGTRVPGGVLAIVTRGLRPVPGDRHSSMEVLVDALERVLGARARRARWAVGGATLGAALLVGNQVAVMSAPVPCEGAEQGLESVWNDARRQSVTAAWPASLAAEQEPALAAIDEWAAQWGGKRREVCEATRVREEQSDHAFALRMACLDRMAARLEVLTGELAEGSMGDPSAAFVRASLPVLAECDDVEALDRLVNRFSSSTLRAHADQDRAWTEAEALITRATMRQRLGRPGWVELAEQALALAERHQLPVVESAALTVLADERLLRGDTKGAAELTHRALGLAIAVGFDDLAVDLALERAEAAVEEGRLDEALVHLSYGDALAARRRRSQAAEVAARRATIVRGRVSLARGEFEAVRRELAPLADDPALPLEHRLTVLNAVGVAEQQLGHGVEAVATWERLLTLVEAERGADSPDLVPPLNNMATLRIKLGRFEAALDDLARAEVMVRRAWGAEHPSLASILGNRGKAERRRGRLAEALALQTQSLALRTRLYGDAHPSLAFPLDELGALARLRGDHAAALEHLDRARHLREQSLGEDHPLVADTLALEAQVHLDRNDAVRARAVLERAFAIVSRDGADPAERAEVELLLAKAHEGGDPATARRFAEAARAHADQAGAFGEAVLEGARAWLETHAAPPAEVPRDRSRQPG
jgi:eukaryotic-like serine/threonine-protein kinase